MISLQRELLKELKVLVLNFTVLGSFNLVPFLWPFLSLGTAPGDWEIWKRVKPLPGFLQCSIKDGEIGPFRYITTTLCNVMQGLLNLEVRETCNGRKISKR